MVFNEGWEGNWPAEQGEEQGGRQGGQDGGQEISVWEAEAAGRFVGFGRAGEEEEAPAPI
jgi:hypothetical protein